QAKALLLGIRLAVRSRQETLVKTDCLDLVNALRNPQSLWPWSCSAWLHTMADLLEANPLVNISFIPRSMNHLADKAAREAARGTGLDSWITSLPYTDLDQPL
ncbi:hypothetical protein LINPERPRIM_LOCUS7684, partial [Linum perenne]